MKKFFKTYHLTVLDQLPIIFVILTAYLTLEILIEWNTYVTIFKEFGVFTSLTTLLTMWLLLIFVITCILALAITIIKLLLDKGDRNHA